MQYSYFAPCPKGLEEPLRAELLALGAAEVRATVAGVSFAGDFTLGMKACLWSRFSSRILLILGTCEVADAQSLYDGVKQIPFDQWFTPAQTICIDFSGVNDSLRNTLYSAQKTKDAVCDLFAGLYAGSRPDVRRRSPDVIISCHLDHNGRLSVCLDLSGRPLLQRGFGRRTGTAPLKENLAAAVLWRCGYQGGNFLDPMCGSGTLLTEAVAMASDCAPGLRRSDFGFMKLSPFSQSQWLPILSEAEVRAGRGLRRLKESGVKIVGYDADEYVLEMARENVRRAGFAGVVTLEHRPSEQMQNPFGNEEALIACNPPYGQRMGNHTELIGLYTRLGRKLRETFAGKKAAVLSAASDLLSCLRLKPDNVYKLYNGALECQLRIFSLTAPADDDSREMLLAPDFSRRLKKNLRRVVKIAAEDDTDAYRVYDADVPEYAAVIDCYAGWYVVQIYKAGEGVDPRIAWRHELDLTAAVLEVTGAEPERIVVKQREIKKGSDQYARADSPQERLVVVHERKQRFYVNVTDYLDSGLFIDGRRVRQLIEREAAGRKFLNLFAYTATASVAAAVGGALSTHSVDMSRTYLQWAQRNFRLNAMEGGRHTLEQADCLRWLMTPQVGRYDLVLLDPPTFSNSKRMAMDFDVRRDQVLLLSNLTRHLEDGARVIFCTNRRSFRLDPTLERFGYTLTEDLSVATLAADCARSADSHHCYLLTFSKKDMTDEPISPGSLGRNSRWSGQMQRTPARGAPGQRKADSPWSRGSRDTEFRGRGTAPHGAGGFRRKNHER